MAYFPKFWQIFAKNQNFDFQPTILIFNQQFWLFAANFWKKTITLLTKKETEQNFVTLIYAFKIFSNIFKTIVWELFFTYGKSVINRTSTLNVSYQSCRNFLADAFVEIQLYQLSRHHWLIGIYLNNTVEYYTWYGPRYIPRNIPRTVVTTSIS